ncbi:13287_t:CDS:2, partial [Racocetra fulgida]
TTIYKDKIKLLCKFKQYVFRKGKKKKQVPIAKEIETDVNAPIDGYTASGKSSVGELLAKKLNYRFIDSGLFYCYIASNFSDLEEFRIILWLSNQQEENILTQVNQINNNQLISDELLIKVANNVNIRKAINKVIQEITKQKGYIVAGRDATFNILPDAEIKIFLTAEFNARVNRRIKQFNIKAFNNVWLEILKQDSSSSDLIKQAKKISQNIDTTYLELSE